jgi:hypothetical protein
MDLDCRCVPWGRLERMNPEQLGRFLRGRGLAKQQPDWEWRLNGERNGCGEVVQCR